MKPENNYELSKALSQSDLPSNAAQRRTPLYLPSPSRHLGQGAGAAGNLSAAAKLMARAASASSLASLPETSVAPKRGGSIPDCVYLRPEQNIPEVFANNHTSFQPIGASAAASPITVNSSGKRPESASSLLAKESAFRKNSPARISRDDIVVTVRSAQV